MQELATERATKELRHKGCSLCALRVFQLGLVQVLVLAVTEMGSQDAEIDHAGAAEA